MENLLDWIAIHQVCWSRPHAAWDMVLRCGGVVPALHAPRGELCSISDDDWTAVEQLRATINWRQASLDLHYIERKGIVATPRGAAGYPGILETILDPPILLFWRGVRPSGASGLPPHPPPNCRRTGDPLLRPTTGGQAEGEGDFIGDAVAIVGARKATAYGREVVDKIVPELVAANITIVSGLAYGIDAHAHRACLAARGRTIAVLASGVDDITPRQHQKLGELIMESGALCSEFPIGTPAYASNFLFRNRIISGLSRATLVVEAEIRSGSLVTARHAADQGRDVFAVPGPITSPLSSGCHQLLKDGAAPCTGAEDLLRVQRSNPECSNGIAVGTACPRNSQKKTGQQKPLDDTTARLLQTLTTGPCTMNQLGDRLQMPIAQVLQLVTTLECAGMIAALPGGFITRT